MGVNRVGRVLARGLKLRCPRCGRGRLFEGPFRMPLRCAQCGLVYEREQGYFLGAIYVNYGITVTLALAGYFALDAWLAPAVEWQLALWAPFTVAFPLWFFRYSKALWLSLDHVVDPGERDHE